MNEVSRRDFLQVATGGAFATLGALAPAEVAAGQSSVAVQAVPTAGDAPAGWFDRPMRWVQLTLVENDPGRFDPQFWLDYFKRLKADAACLSAGGIVAYYPTDVPSITAAPGWVTRTPSARCCRGAGRSA